MRALAAELDPAPAHLRDVPIVALEDAFAAHGLARPAVLASRLALGYHNKLALDLEEAGIGRRTAAALRAHWQTGPQLRVRASRGAEDGTVKHLFDVAGGAAIEAVLLRSLRGRTLCVSSQAGCALGCSFCATGSLGLLRNLSAGEITESFVHAQRASTSRITDIVFMGQGEPLHNYDAVMHAAANFHHVRGHSITKRKITISTAGMAPQVRRFTAERQPWRLHLSLHSAIDETRRALMPIARVYGLDELLDAFREHQAVLSIPWLTFQYVALPEVNMDAAHVEALRERLQGLRVILNVIPWNDTGTGSYRPPTWGEVKEFTTALRTLGCPIKIRYSGGKAEGMGCGQLAAETIALQPRGGHLDAPAGVFSDLPGRIPAGTWTGGRLAAGSPGEASL